ncbi:MAG: DUF2812 domain-containing protein [Clostridia bacterium]
MRIVKRKVFFAWNFEQEEQWLNQMSKEGLQLISVGFCKYVFEKDKNKKYTYKVELLDNLPSNPKSQDYIEFLEETGIEHIGSYIRWIYLRKDASKGEIELFSDNSSRIKHYKKVIFLLMAISPLMIVNLFNLYNFYTRTSSPLLMGILAFNIIISTLMGVGILKLYKAIKDLKKDSSIWE